MATDLESLVLSISADTRQIQRALKRLEGDTAASTRKIESQFAGLGKRLGNSFAGIGSSLKAGLAGLAGAFSARAAQQLIDTAVRVQNSLKVAGLEGKALDDVYRRLFQSAQKNAAPLEALATLYGRAAQNQKELGVSTGQLLTFTDKVAVALRVAGTDASQASGALLQLGQALGSGRVQAEEFNSILEGVLPIAQSAARGIKEAEGSVAKLKSLVIDGKVSSKAFFDGFVAGSTQMEHQASKASMTTSQGFTVLTNSLVDAAKRFDQSSEASKAFGEMLGALAGYIDQLSFDAMLSGLDAVAARMEGMMATIQGWGEAFGEATGAANFGKWLAGTEFGKSMGIQSTSMLRDRMSGEVPKADAVVQAWAQKTYGSQRTTATTGRLPAVPKAEPISLKDYKVPGTKTGGTKTRVDEYAREVQQIRERTAAIQAETSAQAALNPLINDYGFAVEKSRASQELLNAAKAAGKTITPELAAEIENLATKYAEAKVAQDGLTQSQNDAKQAVEEQKTAYAQLGDVGTDAAQSLASALDDGNLSGQELLQILFQVATQLAAMKGLGSIFGNMFSGMTGGAINFFKPGLYASGGRVSGPGSGRSDSIPAMLSNGEFVVNAASAKKFAPLLDAINSGKGLRLADGGLVGAIPNIPQISRGGSSSSVTNTFAPVIQASGNAANDDRLLKEVRKMFDKEFVPKTRAALGTLKRNGML